MTRTLLALMLACLCVPACEKKETPAASTATPAATTAAPTAASARVGDDGEGLPTEEDFEDEAEQKISAQNAEEELDKLEKEISE
ncbi:MAG: hypothetical protein HS104_11150 [Polyangiaceae bacterium]|nr:hypothetical protein [Polyangiaceae bacterium]MCL4748656.1 hypothetical protein [Myxococcales bacterium]